MNEAKKPRIVVFSIAYFPMIGGAEVALKELMTRLPQYHFTLVCAADSFSAPSYEVIDGVEVHRVGRWFAWLGRLRNYFYVILGSRKAKKLHKKQSFDLVWSMMAAYGGGAAYFFNRSTSVPVLLSLQEGDPLSRIENLTKQFSKYYRDFFYRVAYIQTLSTYLADVAKHFGATAPIEVVPNGVDVARFSKPVDVSKKVELRSAWTDRSDSIVVLSVSRLEVKNGIDTLVRSLVHDDRLILVVAGEGSQRTFLVELAKKLGVIDRVHLLGSIENSVLPAYLQSADVFSRPSRSEGQGISFIEAMAAGVPVVGTDVGGIADFALDGGNMLVVEPENPEMLAEALVRASQEDVHARLVEGARKTVAQYDWDDLALRMKSIFEKLIHD